MTFALVLVSLFLLLQLPWIRRRPSLRTQRDRAAVAAGLFFIGAGILHFLSPARFVAMIPPFLPAPMSLVILSGLAEIACGAGLLPRAPAAWATIALLFAILPANVHVALSGGSIDGLPAAGWYYVARVPFQLVFVGWVAWAGALLRRGPMPERPQSGVAAPAATGSRDRRQRRLDK